MKVFIIPLLVAAAAAQPQFISSGIYPSMYTSPVVGSQVLGSPLVYAAKPVEYKPVQTMEYETMDKKVVQEKKPVVETYSAIPSVYGQPIVYKQPIVNLKEKVNVPARFHIKNGALEHTSFQKREAEADPIYPFGYNYNTLPLTTYSGIPTAYSGIPAISAVSPVAPAVIPSVYAAKPIVYQQTPIVKVEKEIEYLKPKVEEQAKTVANDAITHYMYAGKGTFKSENPGAIHIAKREAESFGVYPYSAMPLAASTYGLPAYGNVLPAATYSNILPATTYGKVLPYQSVLPYVAPLKVKTYSNDRLSGKDYAGKDTYVAENAGALHIAKREAEADPLTVYPYNTVAAIQRPITTYTHSSVLPATTLVRSTPFVQTPFVQTPFVNTIPTAARFF